MSKTITTNTGKVISLPNATEVTLYSFIIGSIRYNNKSTQDTLSLLKRYINSLNIKLNAALTWHKDLIDIRASGYAPIISDWIFGAEIPPFEMWEPIQYQLKVLNKINLSADNISALMIMLNYTSGQYDLLYQRLTRYADKNQRGYDFAIEKLEFIRDSSSTIIGAYNPFVGGVYDGVLKISTQASELGFKKWGKIDWIGISTEVIIDELFAIIVDKISGRIIDQLKLPAIQQGLPFGLKERIDNFIRIAPNALKQKIVEAVVDKIGSNIADLIKNTIQRFRNSSTELTWEMVSNTISEQYTSKEFTQDIIGGISEGLMKK